MNKRKSLIFVWPIIVSIVALLASSGCQNPASDSKDPPKSSAKALTAFAIVSPAATGIVSESGHSVTVTLPFGTSASVLSSLTATFATTGISVTAGGVAQKSGVTVNDFTGAVTYSVHAEDGTAQNYVVKISVALSSAKALTAFGIVSPAATGIVTETSHSIALSLPYGTTASALSSLVATFATTGSSVTVGGAAQTSGVTANNFASAVTYTVHAADGSTQDYVVSVAIASSSAKALTAFGIVSPAATGTVTEASHSVSVVLPYGTSASALSSLKATFSTTGSSVTVGGVVQASGSTVNSFASPVTYTVHAADASTQDYVVTVAIALNPAKDITAYSILGNVGVINATAHTIAVTLPYNTAWTSLVPVFTTTGASVKIGAVAQTSGTTSVDFTGGSKTYTVFAADGTTRNYTVTVTNALNPAKSIDSYSILGQAATFSGGGIYVKVPYTQDLRALVATFTYTGASIKVGSTSQVSGSTPNDFTVGGYFPPAIGYTVTAADGTTVTIPVYLTMGTIDTLLPSAGINSSATWTNTGSGTIFYAGQDGTLNKFDIATPATLTTLPGGSVFASGLTYFGYFLYWSDPNNQRIFTTSYSLSGGLTLVAGSGTAGNQNGTGSGASFNFNIHSGITTDDTYLYVADGGNHSIRKISIADSVVTTLATLGSTADPTAIVYKTGYLYVADGAQNVIYKIDNYSGAVSVLSGVAGTQGQVDGASNVAEFHGPIAMKTDGTYLYVVDNGNACLRRVSLADGSVVTLTTTIFAYYGTPNPYFDQTAVRPSSGMVYLSGKLYFNDIFNGTSQIRVLH